MSIVSKKREIYRITFNWYLTGNAKDGFGEDYAVSEIGKKERIYTKSTCPPEYREQTPIKIEKKSIEDCFYIHYDNGYVTSVYHPNLVEYRPLKDEDK